MYFRVAARAADRAVFCDGISVLDLLKPQPPDVSQQDELFGRRHPFGKCS
jgi:hypothetical protein